MKSLNIHSFILFIYTALWPRSQIGGLVSQRMSPRGALTAPNSNGSASTPKKTRRRVASMAQRRAANIRERRRMFNLNEAFDKLRRKVSFQPLNAVFVQEIYSDLKVSSE